MIYFIGVIITMLAFVGLRFFDFNIVLTTVMGIIGFVLALLALIVPRKLKYKEKELVCEYDLLPIAENVYVIQISDGKIIYKYINEDNETKVDTCVSCWKEINELETDGTASIKFYERKPKITLTNWPFLESREEIEINIPKGTIIS